MTDAITWHPSPNFDERPAGQPLDILVIHYTGMKDATDALERLCDAKTQVSSHYMIDESGAVFGLVDESHRAWHAGVSCWRGNRDVNGRSIGIELVNPGHEFGYRPFPEKQMAALEYLALDILRRHPIPARNIIGHSDVAPGRKQDPGELFDWQRLAAADIGLWPDRGQSEEEDANRVGDLLDKFGYDITDLDAAVTAFQRHFRQHKVDGFADKETVERAVTLLTQLANS